MLKGEAWWLTAVTWAGRMKNRFQCCRRCFGIGGLLQNEVTVRKKKVVGLGLPHAWWSDWAGLRFSGSDDVLGFS